MANLRDLRRRIRSVRSTGQITKAMKMVSAARLRRAQDAILAARPYARKLQEVLTNLSVGFPESRHPLLSRREPRAVEIVVVSADRGWCGSFNSNVFRRALEFAREQGERLAGLHVLGRKGRDYFRRRPYTRLSERIDLFRGLDYARASGIADALAQRFIQQEADAIYVVYNEFKSVAQQRVCLEQLLPIERARQEECGYPPQYLYEPEPERLFAKLLPLHMQFQFFRVLLESAAAEHAARMAAMDSATNNAGEMIDSLTLHLNRVRQASITKELIEIVSGAQEPS
jgi:F-type H+-transporting ATPase subunit gamma